MRASLASCARKLTPVAGFFGGIAAAAFGVGLALGGVRAAGAAVARAV